MRYHPRSVVVARAVAVYKVLNCRVHSHLTCEMPSYLLLEFLALGLVSFGCLALTHFVKFKRLHPDLSVEETERLMMAIPTATYIAYRLYFALTRRISSKFPSYAYIRKHY